jgi:hypothetical protein
MVEEDKLKKEETKREIKRLKRNNEHTGRQRTHIKKDINDERNTEIERSKEKNNKKTKDGKYKQTKYRVGKKENSNTINEGTENENIILRNNGKQKMRETTKGRKYMRQQAIRNERKEREQSHGCDLACKRLCKTLWHSNYKISWK